MSRARAIQNIETIVAVAGIIGMSLAASGCTGSQTKLQCQLDAVEQLPKPLDTTSVRDAVNLVARLRECEKPVSADAGQ